MINLYFTILVIFGLFMIWAGFIMFFKPEKVKLIISKAGSTYLINYTELIIRLIVGFCFLKVNSEHEFIYVFIGYFLIFSALLLMLVPIKMHNKFSVYAANQLKPVYLKFFSPISIIMGFLVIYGLF